MTLRNAFDGLATENTLRRLLNVMQLARDSADRLRIIMDGGTVNALGAIQWGSSNATPVPFSTGSPNSMDAREAQRQAARVVFTQRREMWTF